MNGKKYHFYGKSLYIIIIILISNHFLDAKSLNIRIYDHKNDGGYTRIVFENDSSFVYKFTKNSNDDHIIEILGKLKKENILILNKSEVIENPIIESQIDKSKFVFNSKYRFDMWRKFVLKNPFRLVIDMKKVKGGKTLTPIQRTDSVKHKEIKKNPAKHEYKEIIKKPVKIKNEKKKKKISVICIDPGHGGENYGAVGQYLKEKDITLKICRELKRIIINKLKIKVILVRNDDTDISLNKRADIANSNNSDLFISIHVNSSHKGGASGPETFFVSLKATDKESFELARKENMSFKEIDQKVEADGLKMILWNMAQADYIRDSSKLAEFIQQELNKLMNTRNRGVKQAPFRVLMRASMPAVLVEVGFISNKKEENMMKKKEFYEKAALAVFNGLKKYINK